MHVDSEAGAPFAKISSINPANPESWQGKIFLSFDIDWAIDEAVESLADMLEARGVAATFFVTHDSPVLARLASNPLFELGIHPNFDPFSQVVAAMLGRCFASYSPLCLEHAQRAHMR